MAKRRGGFSAELITELPAEGEQGAVTTAIWVFVASSLLNESLHPLLEQWQNQHPDTQIVKEQPVHIEVRKPKLPTPTPPVATAPPKPPVEKA